MTNDNSNNGDGVNNEGKMSTTTSSTTTTTTNSSTTTGIDGGGSRAAGRHNDYITEKELTECDREPVHLMGTIQGGCGHVIFVLYPSAKIIAHDQNIRQVPWIQSYSSSSIRSRSDNKNNNEDGGNLLGSPLQLFLPPELSMKILELCESLVDKDKQRDFYFYKHIHHQEDGSGGGYEVTRQYAVSVSTSNHKIFGIEIEHVESNDMGREFTAALVDLGQIFQEDDAKSVAITACNALYDLIGTYDRGMVYVFHDDLSGEIVYERKEQHQSTSYYGLRFPATDIPLPSRQLYLRNGLRYIRSSEEPDVPILSIKNNIMDLSQIRMRAVNRPHLVYLRNMGVTCTMSVAIKVDNELWGLLAFHGYGDSFKPSLHQRITGETVGSVVSVCIESITRKAATSRLVELGKCTMKFKSDQDILSNLEDLGDKILGVLDADVLVANVRDPWSEDKPRQFVMGDKKLAPSAAFWSKMASLPSKELCVRSTRKLISEDLSLTPEECPASGIVFFQEGCDQIMLGRDIRSKDVDWAGNPDEPKLKIGGILHPRKSFEKFSEKAKMESRAWTDPDIQVIAEFRRRLCDCSHTFMMDRLSADINDANQKYKMALDRARDNYEFFAQMSHELRTPLHGVMGCLKIVREEGKKLSDTTRELVDTAVSSGKHMLMLLNDILSISKNKYLSHVTSSDTVTYQSFAATTITSMRAMAISRSVNLTYSIEPGGQIVIVTDKKKVTQIVSNFANNAIKFTSSGGNVDIKLRLVDTIEDAARYWERGSKIHEGAAFSMANNAMLTTIEEVRLCLLTQGDVGTSSDTMWMLIQVEDSGRGMQLDEIIKVFAPYTQGSYSTRGKDPSMEGTGLGLFICLSLCHQLRGFIGCASSPRKGTSIYVGIPVVVAEKIMVLASDSNRGETNDGDTCKVVMSGPILLVDDNIANLKILRYTLAMELKKAGLKIEIIVAETGPEALVLYRKREPSLCIVDYQMPGMDGLEVSQHVREHEKKMSLRACHFVIFTADATDRAKDIINRGPVDEMVVKPPPDEYFGDLVARLDVV